MPITWMFAGLFYNIRTDNRLKRRTKMAVFVNLLSTNGNGWLETALIWEQPFKAKFITTKNEKYSF